MVAGYAVEENQLDGSVIGSPDVWTWRSEYTPRGSTGVNSTEWPEKGEQESGDRGSFELVLE